MRRGEVWVAKLNPNNGAEVGKVRPVLILLDDALLETGMSPVLCLPLTSQLFTQLAALRVEIPARDRLLKPCYVMPEQLRALDRNRFGDGPLTTLTATEMAQVEQLLLVCCGMADYLNPAH